MNSEAMNAHLYAAEKNLQDAAKFGDEPAKRAILEALDVIRDLIAGAELDHAISEPVPGITDATGARMAELLRTTDILREMRTFKLPEIPPP